MHRSTTTKGKEPSRSATGEDRACPRCRASLPLSAETCPACGATPRPGGSANEFAQEAAGDRIGFFAEFWDFLKHNKKWWLIPILLMIVLVGVVALLASNPAATPFIYPFF